MSKNTFIDDEDLSLTCARLTEKTAIAVSHFIGSGDEEKATRSGQKGKVSFLIAAYCEEL